MFFLYNSNVFSFNLRVPLSLIPFSFEKKNLFIEKRRNCFIHQRMFVISYEILSPLQV